MGPFAATIGLFAMSYLGIAISLWPYAVPRHYTLWEAASAPSAQVFLGVGTMFLLPIIIMSHGMVVTGCFGASCDTTSATIEARAAGRRAWNI